MCKVTEGEPIEHEFIETSASDGHKVGSVITKTCKVCQKIENSKIEMLQAEITCYPTITMGNAYMQAAANVTVTGGYGEYEYRYTIFYGSNPENAPDESDEFVKSNHISWNNPFYCNGNEVWVTVRDEAGNEITAKAIVY